MDFQSPVQHEKACPHLEGIGLLTLDFAGGYEVHVCLPEPTPEDIRAFRSRWRFGIYVGEGMPWGLPLASLAHAKPENQQWLLAFPFDPVKERQQHPGLVGMRTGAAGIERHSYPMLNAYLMNVRNDLKAGAFLAPPLSWVERLDDLWRGGKEPGYFGAYQAIKARNNLAHLWRLSEKF